jgi:Abortive infection alpha
MTGGEILPVAKAASTVAKMAASEAADRKALQDLSKSSPNMAAAAESYARRVAVKQAVLLKIYRPLARFLGVSRNYFDTNFHSDMAQKLANIPDEHLATPPPSVAIPAMLGLSYSIDEPDLKEMYLNLLATATDERTQEHAHPSFADIIKQLSPREASLLLETLRQPILPIIRLGRRKLEGIGESIIANHILPLYDTDDHSQVDEPSLSVWIDNWARLGLISVEYSRSLVEKQRYDWIDTHPRFVQLAAEDPRGEESLNIGRGTLRPTDFGTRFLASVSFDDVPLEAADVPPPSAGDDAGVTT